MKGELTLSFSNQHSLENNKIYMYCHLTQPVDYYNKVQVILKIILPSHRWLDCYNKFLQIIFKEESGQMLLQVRENT